MVESTMTYLLSGSSSNTWKIFSQIPDLAQRVNRFSSCRTQGAGLSIVRHCAAPTEPALVETGDAVHEVAVVLGSNSDPTGPPG